MRTSMDKIEFSNLGWKGLPCWSSGQDSALPMQGGSGLIPGQGIRSHMP